MEGHGTRGRECHEVKMMRRESRSVSLNLDDFPFSRVLMLTD